MLTGHDYPISSVAFSADETLLVTGAKDQSVRVWRADGTGEPLVLQGEGRSPALAFSPDGKRSSVSARKMPHTCGTPTAQACRGCFRGTSSPSRRGRV